MGRIKKLRDNFVGFYIRTMSVYTDSYVVNYVLQQMVNQFDTEQMGHSRIPHYILLLK